MSILLTLGAIVLAVVLIAGLVSPTGRRFLRNVINPPDKPVDPDEPVAIMRNLYETEAEMMCERLKSEGIASFVRGLRPDPMFGRINADLCVASRDAERALEILSHDAGDEADAEHEDSMSPTSDD